MILKILKSFKKSFEFTLKVSNEEIFQNFDKYK